MKRFIQIIKISVLLICFLSESLFAENVPITRAAIVAKNAYLEKCYYSNISIAASEVEISNSYTVTEGAAEVCHIFNFTNNGFAIISADDDLVPVFGYSLDASYDPDNLPPQFSELLDIYKEQVISTIANRCVNADNSVDLEWQKYESGDIQVSGASSIEAVAPLITSNWSQGCGWNQYCPAATGGPCSRALVGCVAVAMGQVLNYHKFPVKGSSSRCYTSSYGQLCADFGATTYGWSSMSDNTATAATATLLYHCGVSVDMGYGPSSSGIPVSALSKVTYAFANYFNYNPNCAIKYRSSYTTSDWDNMVRAEIDNKRPLFYVGLGTGGHAFNVDGYQGTNYFHLNWGWAGSCNGYFYLSNLNPCGSSFTNSQAAAFNVSPNQSCPSGLSITTNIASGSHDFPASGTIAASNVISGGATVHYGAPSVRLTNGFRVYTANHFVANTKGCTSSASKSGQANEVADMPESPLRDKATDNMNRQYKAYPNPSDGYFTVETGNGNPKRVLVYNADGVQVVDVKFNSDTKTIQIPNAIPGIYTLKIILGSDVVVGKMMVK